jgi:hypothetical protein
MNGAVLAQPCRQRAAPQEMETDVSEKLEEAIEKLKVLFDGKCTRKQALKAWADWT